MRDGRTGGIPGLKFRLRALTRHEVGLRRLGSLSGHSLSAWALPHVRPNPRRRVSWWPQPPLAGISIPGSHRVESAREPDRLGRTDAAGVIDSMNGYRFVRPVLFQFDSEN